MLCLQVTKLAGFFFVGSVKSNCIFVYNIYIMKSYTRKELAAAYGISVKVLAGWIKEIPCFPITKSKVLTPLQVELIFNFHGDPFKVGNK